GSVDRRLWFDRNPRRDPDRERIMRLVERDPGHLVAEEVGALPALDRRRPNVERSSMDALPLAIDRGEPQCVMRICDLGRILVDRLLTDVVDHPSASQCASTRSREMK